MNLIVCLGLVLLSLLSNARASEINWDSFNSSLLIEIKRGDVSFTCSGVAIGQRLVLTSAHCFDDVDSARILLDAQYDPRSKNEVVVKNFELHPLYDPKKSLYKHHLAILHLAGALPHNINIATIKQTRKLAVDLEVDRIGFGGRGSLNTRTWTNPRIKKIDNEVLELTDSMSVVGDSGGPVYLQTPQGIELVGLHSTLEGNNKTYSVYLPHYKNWIEKTTSTL